MFVRAKHFDDRTYYYLVENQRIGDRVVQKVIKYLGKDKNAKACTAAAFFLLFFLQLPGCLALTCNTTANGLWQSAATWDCGVVPGASDDARIGHTVSVNASVTTKDVTVLSGGYLTGLGYDHSFNSLVINSGGTYNATSGKTTITSVNGYNSLYIQSGGTFIHNNGTVQIDYGAENWLRLQTQPLYNLIVNSANCLYRSSDAIIANNLTINTGKILHYYSFGDGTRLRVGGKTSVQGTLETDNGQNHDFGSLRIEAGGEFWATNGTINITNGNLVNHGKFYNGSGTVRFSDNGYIIGVNATWPLHRLVIDAGKNVTAMSDGLVAAGEVTVNGRLDARQNALRFDGTDDYVTTPLYPSTALGQQFTVSAWVYPTSGDDYRGIAGGHVGNYTGFTCLQYQGGPWVAGYGNGTAWTSSAGTNLNINRWTHITCVIDAGNYINLYVNGNLAATASPVGPIAHHSQFWIGRAYNDITRYFKGSIDEVRLYSRLLSAAEVAEQYHNVYSNEASLVARWRFTEGSGTTTADESGNGNTGTLTYGPAWVVSNSSFGGLRISPGGAYNATSGVTNITNGNFINYGAFYNNSGTVRFSGNGYVMGVNATWPFNNLLVDAGKNVTHTSDGLVATGSATVSGLLDSNQNALYFDGVDDFVEVPYNSDFDPGSSAFTVEAWFKANSVGGQYYSIIYNKENLFELSAGGGYVNYAWSPHWAWDGDTSFPINVGEWYHATVVYDKAAQYMYKNGQLVYSRPQTGDMGTAAIQMRFGARGTTAPGSLFNGAIDEIRIYRRALSASEVYDHYHNAYSDESNLVGKWRFNDPATEYPNATGLKGHWHFNEGTGGTTADSSGNGNTGTLYNSPTWNGTGRFGSALTFDGTDDYVSVPDSNSLDITNSITLEAWVYIPSVSAAYWGIIEGQKPYYRYLLYTGNSKFNMYINTNAGVYHTDDTSNTANLQTGWNHVVGTYNGSEVRIYRDGVAGRIISASGSIKTDGNGINIGRYDTAGHFFPGTLDEVAIYNRALSADEIAAHARRLAFDSSGRGNNGTLNSTPAWVVPNVNYGGLYVQASGTYSATSGATTITGFRGMVSGTVTDINGGYMHNNGLFNASAAYGGEQWQYMGNAKFYNLSISTSPGYNIFYESFTVENEFRTASAITYFYAVSSPITITLGNSTRAASFVSTSTAGFSPYGTSTSFVTVQGNSSNYPAAVTGADIDWDLGGANQRIDVKNLDYRIDAVTGGGGVTVNFIGNMTLDAFTVSAGGSYNDVLSITTPGVVVTGDPAKNFIVAGIANITGSPDNYVKINGFAMLYVPTIVTSSVLRYLEVNAANAAGSMPLWINGYAFTIENCIFNKSVLGDGVVLSSGGTMFTFRNVTIKGTVGAAASQQHVYLYGGPSYTNKLLCINCSFETVGFNYPSGWAYSKQHNGDRAQTKIWGNFSYTKPVLNQNTVGYWRFDENGSNAVYDHTDVNNGTVYGAQWAPGRFGRALRFDGTDDYVEVPDSSSLDLTNQGTVEMWLYMNSYPTNYPSLIQKGGGSGWASGKYSIFWHLSYPTFMATLYNGSLFSACGFPVGSVTAGAWHHVAFTWDGKTMISYVDGAAVNTCAQTLNTTADASNLWIGKSAAAVMNATIDEVRISNRALLPSEFLPFEHDATLTTLPAGSGVTVPSGTLVTFSNVTENGTISVAGALHRYGYVSMLALNGSGSGVSGASLNVTDGFTGDLVNGTTNSTGGCLPHVFRSSLNNSVLTTLMHNVTAGKAGVGWNSVLMNSTRGNYSITLGASTGYGEVGNLTSSGFTPNITVDGTPFIGPYAGVHSVEIRNGPQPVAVFSHNFSAEDLDLNSITTRLGQYWVGFSGKPVATLYVPLRGSYCNIRTCPSITNMTEAGSCSGWSSADSEPQGWYCIVTINGTVAEEQADPVVTKLTAAPLGWELAAVLFAAAGAIALAPKRRCGKRRL